MADFDEFEFVPLSVIMASGERLLAYGVPSEDEHGRVLLRFVLCYETKENGNVALYDYDPATDDEYIIFNMADILAINSMSDRFHSIYMDFHDRRTMFDLEDYSKTDCISMGILSSKTYQ